MKSRRIAILIFLAAGFTLPVIFYASLARGQTSATSSTTTTVAPTGFDNLTNGLVSQATHLADKGVFSAFQKI